MTRWSEYVHYDCETCGDICINHSDTDHTQLRLCRDCHREAVLNEVEQYLLAQQEDTPATSERPTGAPPSHGGSTEVESARPRATARGQSQRESPAEGPERGTAVRSLLNTVDSLPIDSDE